MSSGNFEMLGNATFPGVTTYVMEIDIADGVRDSVTNALRLCHLHHENLSALSGIGTNIAFNVGKETPTSSETNIGGLHAVMDDVSTSTKDSFLQFRILVENPSIPATQDTLLPCFTAGHSNSGDVVAGIKRHSNVSSHFEDGYMGNCTQLTFCPSDFNFMTKRGNNLGPRGTFVYYNSAESQLALVFPAIPTNQRLVCAIKVIPQGFKILNGTFVSVFSQDTLNALDGVLTSGTRLKVFQLDYANPILVPEAVSAGGDEGQLLAFNGWENKVNSQVEITSEIVGNGTIALSLCFLLELNTVFQPAWTSANGLTGVSVPMVRY